MSRNLEAASGKTEEDPSGSFLTRKEQAPPRAGYHPVAV